MSNLAWRLISSTFIVIVVLAGLLWAPLWGFTAVMLLFVVTAQSEFYTMVSGEGILLNKPLGIGLGVAFAILLSFSAFTGSRQLPLSIWEFQALFWPAALVLISLVQLSGGISRQSVAAMGLLFFGLLYIPGLVGHFVLIRALDMGQGALWVVFLILVTKLSDAGAYLVGKSMGRHRFVPRISPNKTWEGVAGGLLASGLTALIARGLLGFPISAGRALFVGIVLGVVGLAGDLVESLIKRACAVKDSGDLIPGLGGVLDVMDSLVFTAPVFYVLLRVLN